MNAELFHLSLRLIGLIGIIDGQNNLAVENLTVQQIRFKIVYLCLDRHLYFEFANEVPLSSSTSLIL